MIVPGQCGPVMVTCSLINLHLVKATAESFGTVAGLKLMRMMSTTLHASRDKTVKIWRSTTVDGKITEFKDILSIPTLSTPATSIDIIKVGNNDYRMAVGLDTGDLITYKLELVSGEAKVHVLPENGNLIDKAITPAARVEQNLLDQWRPRSPTCCSQ